MAIQPSLVTKLMLKQLGSNANLAISFPTVDGSEDPTAATGVARTGLWAVAGTSITATVNAIDVFKVTTSNAFVGTSPVWHSGNFDPTLYQTLALKGVANGYASLDSDGKVPTAQLPASAVNTLNLVSAWNASTNSPSLTSGVGTTGQFYRVTTAGITLLDGTSDWNIGDIAWYNGSQWQRIVGGASTVSTNPMGAGVPANLVSSSTTAIDSFTDELNFAYKWTVCITNGTSLSQMYDILATRILTSPATFSVDATNTVGNHPSTVTAWSVQVIGGALQLRVTIGAVTSLVARVRRWQPL